MKRFDYEFLEEMHLTEHNVGVDLMYSDEMSRNGWLENVYRVFDRKNSQDTIAICLNAEHAMMVINLLNSLEDATAHHGIRAA